MALKARSHFLNNERDWEGRRTLEEKSELGRLDCRRECDRAGSGRSQVSPPPIQLALRARGRPRRSLFRRAAGGRRRDLRAQRPRGGRRRVRRLRGVLGRAVPVTT